MNLDFSKPPRPSQPRCNWDWRSVNTQARECVVTAIADLLFESQVRRLCHCGRFHHFLTVLSLGICERLICGLWMVFGHGIVMKLCKSVIPWDHRESEALWCRRRISCSCKSNITMCQVRLRLYYWRKQIHLATEISTLNGDCVIVSAVLRNYIAM